MRAGEHIVQGTEDRCVLGIEKQDTSGKEDGGKVDEEIHVEEEQEARSYFPSDMAVEIKSWASSLSSSVRNRYLVKHVLDHEPEDIIWRIEPPTWYKKDAPPLRKECPEYREGSRPQEERVDLSLSVKSL